MQQATTMRLLVQFADVVDCQKKIQPARRNMG
jgi:hypothetical protein